VVVIRTGDRTILVDAGLGGQFDGFPRAGQFPQRMAAAGIDLGSLTDIVITHMHMDHVGGLLIDDVKNNLRPDVRIHVSAAEVEFWKAPDFSRTAMPSPIPDVLRSTAQQFAEDFGDKIQTFLEEYEVAPGVVVQRIGGHTPGHSVVRVTSGGDQLTFAGDALFPVAFDHPDWQNGFEHDPEEATRVRLRLMREAAASGEPGGGPLAVPIRRPGGGQRRCVPLGRGVLGLLIACKWVRPLQPSRAGCRSRTGTLIPSNLISTLQNTLAASIAGETQ
jgi:glyoxylase-like metal-dependent hydrolase (beta-lactamase superfamily II)